MTASALHAGGARATLYSEMFAVDGADGRSKLRTMQRFRRARAVTTLILLAACDRSKAPPPPDTTVAIPLPPADSAIVATTRNWDTNAGPVLLVAAGSPSEAFIIPPDSATAETQLSNLPRPASVTLFGRGGTVQTAILPALSDSNGCAVGALAGAPPPRPWSIGFIGGVVAPVALDSVESMTPADSAELAIVATRLASAVPNDTSGRFTGLPFIVRSLWRFTLPSGPTTLIATLTRQINQEATPLQEQTLIIAERTPNDTVWTTTYSERSIGNEETVESRDLLAVALLGPSRTPALILTRDDGEGTAYGLVERSSDGTWQPRWRSARRRC